MNNTGAVLILAAAVAGALYLARYFWTVARSQGGPAYYGPAVLFSVIAALAALDIVLVLTPS